MSYKILNKSIGWQMEITNSLYIGIGWDGKVWTNKKETG